MPNFHETPPTIPVFQNRDRVIYQGLSSTEEIVYSTTHICFGLFGSHHFRKEFLEVPDLTYFQTWFGDSLSLVLKEEGWAEKFIDALKTTGLLENVDLKVLDKKDITKKESEAFSYVASADKALRMVRLRFDLNKVSSPEMFLIICTIRTLAINPGVIYDSLLLWEKHPDVSYWNCLIAAHGINMGTYRSHHPLHGLCSSKVGYVLSTVEEILEVLKRERKVLAIKDMQYTRVIWDTVIHADFRYGPIPAYSEELFNSYMGEKQFKEYVKAHPKTNRPAW